jgi:hypothetical protein
VPDVGSIADFCILVSNAYEEENELDLKILGGMLYFLFMGNYDVKQKLKAPEYSHMLPALRELGGNEYFHIAPAWIR